MEDEGVAFVTGAHIGVTRDAAELRNQFDAVALATGATKPRDLPVPGPQTRPAFILRWNF